MLSSLWNMFRVPDLRNKILFTIFIIGIFRLGSHIPVPYVDFRAIKELKDSDAGGVVAFRAGRELGSGTVTAATGGGALTAVASVSVRPGFTARSMRSGKRPLNMLNDSATLTGL